MPVPVLPMMMSWTPISKRSRISNKRWTSRLKRTGGPKKT
jgi:hypothetical protein